LPPRNETSLKLLGVRSDRDRVDKGENVDEKPVRTLVDAILVVSFHGDDKEQAACQCSER